MTGTRPLRYLWWLVSDASGIVALVARVGLRAAGTGDGRQGDLAAPGAGAPAARLHEHVALAALAAIAVHGLALLGDQWLKPGWRGIVVPFALSYRPGFTGIGIVAGYLAVLVGPTLLPAPPDRRAEMASAASRDRARLDPVGRARAWAPDRTHRSCGCARSCSRRSLRSSTCSSFGCSARAPDWRACRATGAERAPAPRSAGDRLRGRGGRR